MAYNKPVDQATSLYDDLRLDKGKDDVRIIWMASEMKKGRYFSTLFLMTNIGGELYPRI